MKRLFAAALILAAPAQAQTAATAAAAEAAAALAAEKARTDALVAQTAATKAETDLLAARVAALGLKNEATGKTTVDDKVGSVEGRMLAARGLAAAGPEIARGVDEKRAGRPVVILGNAGIFAFDQPVVVRQEMTRLGTMVTSALAPCRAAAGEPVVTESIMGALPAIGAVVNALKTDVDIKGFDAQLDERVVINAVAAARDFFIVPAEAVRPDEKGSLFSRLAGLRELQGQAAACRLRSAAGTPAAAALDASITAIEAFSIRVTAAGAEGRPSILAQAALVDAIAALNPMVLRVSVEATGGSLLVRKNLFTALGAPAVGLTGGGVVSWRLTDPASGGVKAAGVLVCRTALTNLRAIHANTARAGDCK